MPRLLVILSLCLLAIGAATLSVVAVDRDEAEQNAALDRIECTLYSENCATPTPVVEPDIPFTVNLNLNSTFQSIGFEATGANEGVAQVKFREPGAASWRNGLPAWYAADSYYGSALLLPPGTLFDVRVITDSGTVYGGQIATRAETIPAPGTLVPTHTLGVGGDYSTLQQTFTDAPAGAIVRVLAGSYAPTNTQRTTPITLLGDPGAVVEPQTVINPGGWQLVNFTGPATGGNFSVWHTVAPVLNVNQVVVETATAPYLVANWDRDNDPYQNYTMTTPAGWAEVLHLNGTYNYGFTAFGSDLYLRLPHDANPNDTPIRVHYVNGYDKGRLVFSGANTRVSGLTFRGVELLLRSEADNSIIDHNTFENADLYFHADQNTTPQNYVENAVVEENTFVLNGLYDRNLGHDAVAWKFIKAKLLINGQITTWQRTGDNLEITAIGGRGGARTLVVRNNSIDGYFNGIGAYSAGYDRYNKSGYDVYSNTWQHIADDVFETDTGGMNWRVWDNTVRFVSIGVSFGNGRYGPTYLFRNEFLEMTNDGVGADSTGDTTVGVNGFKYSGSSNPPLLAYVINNTFHSDDPEANGGLQSAGGGGSPEWFYVRNNIFDMQRYVFSAKLVPKWNEDYNAFATTDPTRGLEYGGQNKLTLALYRAASGQGAHSNPHGDFHDPITAASLVDTGVVVPMIAETFNGSAPDIGAVESGS